MRSEREIAESIVKQALAHPDAVETKISAATLLVGIEEELKRARAQKKSSREVSYPAPFGSEP